MSRRRLRKLGATILALVGAGRSIRNVVEREGEAGRRHECRRGTQECVRHGLRGGGGALYDIFG